MHSIISLLDDKYISEVKGYSFVIKGDGNDAKIVDYSFDMDLVNEDNVFEKQYDEIVVSAVLEPISDRLRSLEATFRLDGAEATLFFTNELNDSFHFMIRGFPGEAEMERYEGLKLD